MVAARAEAADLMEARPLLRRDIVEKSAASVRVARQKNAHATGNNKRNLRLAKD
jgi:hypothetical protein